MNKKKENIYKVFFFELFVGAVWCFFFLFFRKIVGFSFPCFVYVFDGDAAVC